MTPDAKPSSRPLTVKQAKFVSEYLVDLNARQAAIRAGYSKRSAAVIGHENLNKPYIASAIAVAVARREKRTEITQDRVLLEYARIAFADMDTYVTWGPGGVTLNESSELPVGASAAVSEVTESVTEKGNTVRFKLHDKQAALGMLAKHLGMMPDKIEHGGPDGGPIRQEIVTLDITASDFGEAIQALVDAGAVRVSGHGQSPVALDEVHPASADS